MAGVGVWFALATGSRIFDVTISTSRLSFAIVALLSSLASVVPARAADPVLETWHEALLEGQKAGYIHFIVEEDLQAGQKVLVAKRELRLALRRGPDVAQIIVDVGSVELPDGTVRQVSMTQALGQQQLMRMVGDVEGNQVTIKVQTQDEHEVINPWPDGTLGLFGEYTLFEDKAVQPGDEFDYTYFEPTVSHVVRIQVKVGEVEPVNLPNAPVRHLLRVEATPEKIQDVQLPAAIHWLDPTTFEPVLVESELPGLGALTAVLTTEEAARAPFQPQVQVFNQSVVLRSRVLNVHDLRSVTYRVALPGDDDPAAAFPIDARQSIEGEKGEPFEVTVVAIREPQKIDNPEEIGDEYTTSNFFINSEDERVKALAQEAISNETDPWRKAQRVERWVHQNMRSLNFSEAMATSDHVAQTLSGDCTEFAMLTAALCRAAGVPSRTAIGLIYVDSVTEPVMAFHMWTEVAIDGQWLALDATLGKGSVGPGHLKITDHSWHDTRSFTPLLPLMRVLIGKPEIEILRATREGN